ncbi:MAG: thiamine diphosphokinase [Bacillota bacterium]
MRCVIFVSGPIDEYSVVRVDPGDVVIAVDGGAHHAEAIGIVPGFIIGDMDSVEPGLLEHYEKMGCQVLAYPREKDEVDTELALDYAISLNPDEIVIYGATGGRLDHVLACIHLLAKPAIRGIRAHIEDHCQRVTLVTPGIPSFIKGMGSVFTLLPLTTSVEGVTTRGARWELRGALFEIGRPYGVSNIADQELVSISITGGMMLLIEVNGE